MATSPLDVPCRFCGAAIGEKCTTVPQANSRYVRILECSHATRWRDLNSQRNDLAKMADWNQRYGEKQVL